MNKRFELRYGKFGAYFYDTFTGMDMGLMEVLERLNGEYVEQSVFN